MTFSAVKTLSGGAPEFCIKFQKTICRTQEMRDQACQKGLCIRWAWDGYYIEKFDHFARQWRLANGFESISFATDSGISQQMVEKYAPLIKISWAVGALERYCDVFDKKWYDRAAEIFSSVSSDLSEDVRKVVNQSSAKKISNSLNDKLKIRWQKFVDGDDVHLVAIAIGIRNAYSHGQVWGASELASVLPDLTEYVLQAIKKDSEAILTEFNGNCEQTA